MLEIFKRVNKIVKDRGVYYGHPMQNHQRTADLWSAYLGIKISTRQVCILNSLQKISRDAHVRKPDNIDDIIGYMANIAMIEQSDVPDENSPEKRHPADREEESWGS